MPWRTYDDDDAGGTREQVRERRRLPRCVRHAQPRLSLALPDASSSASKACLHRPIRRCSPARSAPHGSRFTQDARLPDAERSRACLPHAAAADTAHAAPDVSAERGPEVRPRRSPADARCHAAARAGFATKRVPEHVASIQSLRDAGEWYADAVAAQRWCPPRPPSPAQPATLCRGSQAQQPASRPPPAAIRAADFMPPLHYTAPSAHFAASCRFAARQRRRLPRRRSAGWQVGCCVCECAPKMRDGGKRLPSSSARREAEPRRYAFSRRSRRRHGRAQTPAACSTRLSDATPDTPLLYALPLPPPRRPRCSSRRVAEGRRCRHVEVRVAARACRRSGSRCAEGGSRGAAAGAERRAPQRRQRRSRRPRPRGSSSFCRLVKRHQQSPRSSRLPSARLIRCPRMP